VIPRIRGKVGQVDHAEPGYEKLLGKWMFTVWMTEFGKGDGEELGTFGPYETEAGAKKGLNDCVKKICEEWEMKVAGKKSGVYVDIKTNETRSWK